MIGSSPRLRGTRPDAGHGDPRERFIPAPAGNTPRTRTRTSTRTVHPRACGEHATLVTEEADPSGSSPRLRGTRKRASPIEPGGRFIPAPAGNTPPSGRSACGWAVHPRACGEHLKRKTIETPEAGSSPRLRGTRPHQVPGRHRRRFIPAPAGNTSCAGWNTGISTVHPRACGEHTSTNSAGGLSIGSSPRLRGTHVRRNGCLGQRRFIPAPAGNTCEIIARRGDFSVHPRACGEHLRNNRAPGRFFGSSPRLRGTLGFARRDEGFKRFIPAPAGNTPPTGSDDWEPPVHPRACGEHLCPIFSCQSAGGSSPRLRGTLALRYVS